MPGTSTSLNQSTHLLCLSELPRSCLIPHDQLELIFRPFHADRVMRQHARPENLVDASERFLCTPLLTPPTSRNSTNSSSSSSSSSKRACAEKCPRWNEGPSAQYRRVRALARRIWGWAAGQQNRQVRREVNWRISVKFVRVGAVFIPGTFLNRLRAYTSSPEKIEVHPPANTPV